MLKKYAKIIAIGFVLGMAAFMPAAESNPLIADKAIALKKEDKRKENENDDSEGDKSMTAKKLEQDTQKEDDMIFEFPKLTGTYSVGATSRYLVDKNRKESHNPEAQRELMIYLWYPTKTTTKNNRVVYGNSEINEEVKESLMKQGYPAQDIAIVDTTYTHATPNVTPLQQAFPVLIFSHGYLGCHPSMYTAICEELASHGYIVVSIAHTYFAKSARFPDGRIISPAPEKYTQKKVPDADLNIWLNDVRYILDTLQTINNDTHDSFYHCFDMQRIGMLGHSFGGIAAFEMCMHDARVKAGINIDGYIWGDSKANDMTKPFLFMLAQENIDLLTQQSMTDEEMASKYSVEVEQIVEHRNNIEKICKYMQPTKTLQRVIIPETKHMSFSDLMILKEIPLFKNNKQIVDFDVSIGKANGFEVMATINREIVQFFDNNLYKQDDMVAKKLEQNTQLTTLSGCTFTAEKGWFVSSHHDAMIFEEPDRELMMALIENNELTAQDAVLAAWKKVQPDFARTIQHRVQSVPQDGWDEIVRFVYDSSTQENRFIFATARRVGNTWYVELIDGTKAAFERRMAGVCLINTSFKVPGAQAESFAHKKAHTLTAAQLKEFMAFVEQALIECEITGPAGGIVQEGKLILEQGLGVCELGKQDNVTSQTLFMIGSTTKALTTFMMAHLVDEGKFTWDTPVTQVMPNFALGDEATTKQLLMKYMVSASTGIPRQDLELFFNYDQATPELRIQEMRDMKPTTGFGETFQYSNSMVSAGGYTAAYSVDKNSGLGKAYDDVMQSRVFDPIDMKATTFDFARAEKVDHATPHGIDLHGTYAPLEIGDEKCVESVRPAGGAWSNVQDMAQYMIVELNNGVTANGKRVISQENLLKRREPQIKITDKLSYGLGLMMENDHGVLVVGHDGMNMGFSSQMFFLPEHNIGLVMLTNARGAMTFTQAVKRKLMELLFDGKAQAWEMVKVGVDQQKKMFEKSLEDINFKPDSAWLKQFVGTYTHPTLGQIIIREVAGGAELDAHVWKSALGQKREKDGTLKVILTELPFAGVEFLPKQHDGVMQLELQSGQHNYVFERK